MKKKILIPIIALGAIFAGCSSDKSSDPVANDVTGEAPLQHPQAAVTDDDEFVEDELEERTDGCSVGLSMTTKVDPEDSKAVILEVVAEKACAPNNEIEFIDDIYGDLSYGLRTRTGEVVAEPLAVGEVHYGCIDLTDVSNPKFKRDDCTGIAPGTYRLNVMYEGKSTYFKFRVQGEIEE